jgi:hypothetical protein
MTAVREAKKPTLLRHLLDVVVLVVLLVLAMIFVDDSLIL